MRLVRHHRRQSSTASANDIKDVMQVRLNTDSNIDGDERLAEITETIVSSSLRHLESRVTRVEVYLVDANATKGGPYDTLCTIEACPEGLRPQVAADSDAEVEAALRGAAKKMRAVLDSYFGKLSRR
jgi:hypothetical protein